MKNTSNIAKFFIVCAVVFAVGLITTALGAAFGGIDDFGKVAEKREWIQGDPGKKVEEYVKVGDFDTVEIKGCADINFVTEEWSADEKSTTSMAYKPGHVLVVRGSKVDAPDIKVEKGVLYITAPDTEFNGISFSFSDVPRTPGVFVFCTDEQLKAIKADSTYGDLSFMGIRFDKADIESNSGDIFIKDVRGNKLSLKENSGDIVASGRFEGPTEIKTTSGDVRLSGKFLGETDVNITSGDFTLNTEVAMEKYAIDVQAISGDVRVTSNGTSYEYDDTTNKFNLKGGPHKLSLQSIEGDVELFFG